MTCLVSGNSDLAGQGYRAPGRSATPIYDGCQPRGQGNSYQTHLNHDEHGEAIEKGGEYLVEVLIQRQGYSKRRVTSYSDRLSKDNLCQGVNSSELRP
jgi:hypothetical protein